MRAGQADPGHRYGCWGRKRGGTNTAFLPTHRVQVAGPHCEDGEMVRLQVAAPITTDWLDIPCGHDLRYEDAACAGCGNVAAPKTIRDLVVGDRAWTDYGETGVFMEVEIVAVAETKYSQTGISYRAQPRLRNCGPYTFLDAGWFKLNKEGKP